MKYSYRGYWANCIPLCPEGRVIKGQVLQGLIDLYFIVKCFAINL
ncbi:hypothetical protein BH20BAC1_BH20BAC1_25510 [soil metagenome]